MKIFFFEDKHQSFIAGVTYSLAFNSIAILILLITYGIASLFNFGKLGFFFFVLYIINISYFSNQLYILIASFFANSPSYRYRMDFGALFGYLLFTIAIAWITLRKFDLVPITKESYSTLVICGFFSAVFSANTFICDNKSLCDISLTCNKNEVNSKVFYLEERKLKYLNIFWVACVALIWLVFYIFMRFGWWM